MGVAVLYVFHQVTDPQGDYRAIFACRPEGISPDGHFLASTGGRSGLIAENHLDRRGWILAAISGSPISLDPTARPSAKQKSGRRPPLQAAMAVLAQRQS